MLQGRQDLAGEGVAAESAAGKAVPGEGGRVRGDGKGNPLFKAEIMHSNLSEYE
jgi:hypothetical protein